MARDIYDFEHRRPSTGSVFPERRPMPKLRGGTTGARTLRLLVNAALWVAFVSALLLTTVKVIRTLSFSDVDGSGNAIQDQLRPSR